MRAVWLCILTGIAALAADKGLPPRPNSTDYPVHASVKTAAIGAVIVPPDRVTKLFSEGISKQYVVVEVAIYPEDGHSFDVQASDFALRIGRQISRAEKPRDVAPWPERRDSASRAPVDVSTETGVIYSRTSDPVNGTRHSVGTYEGVSVSGPRQPGPPPRPKPGADPRVIEERALPEGQTRTPVAGYLYFPLNAKRSKSDAMELDYANGDVTANLVFPR